MYRTIMVPVDLSHIEKLDPALTAAADLAKHWGAQLVFVGVTTPQPSPVAHTPAEYAEKLDEFANRQSTAHGVRTLGKAYTSHDPAIDLDDTLLKAVDETGADLVVMQSHIPNIADHLWPSNGGTIASDAKVSVLVVR